MQLWEPLLHEHKGSQTAERIWKGLLSVWPFVVAVFICIAVVSMTASWTEGLFSDGLQCPRCRSRQGLSPLRIAHTLRNSAAARPADVRVCFYPMSTLLSCQRAATTAVCACCLYVCEREGRDLSLALIFAHCSTLSDRCHTDMQNI